MKLGLVIMVALSIACSKPGDDLPGTAGTTGQAGVPVMTGMGATGGTAAADGGRGGQWIDAGLAGAGGAAGQAGSGGTGGFVPPGVGGRWLTADLQAQLAAAAAFWAGAKASCTVYSYDRVWSSSFTGQYKDTYVEVTNDTPTRYHTVSGARPPRGNPNLGVTEVDLRGDQITNPASLTVEGLLAECASVLTVDQNQTTIRLVISELGVPTICDATPKNCADDCTSGIQLAPFVCAPLGADGTISPN